LAASAAITAITAPIFLLIGLEFVAVSADWVPREGRPRHGMVLGKTRRLD